MGRTEKAKETFDSGFNCAQSVFTTFSDEVGLDREQALRAACAFGGGMGRMGKTCGAVSGAFMVIGLKHGQTICDDKTAKDKTYALVREFADLFMKEHGSTDCSELLSCDITTSEGFQIATEQKLFKTVCPRYVESAVKILEKLL